MWGGVLCPLSGICVVEVPVTRKLKPIEVPLREEVVEGILALPVEDPQGEITTVGKTVALAARLIESANRAVEENALCSIVADTLMKEQKRRGTATIRVRSDCTVVLHISYTGEDEDEDVKHSPSLPSLEELRTRASTEGVDISDLGRQKRAILERLENEGATISR
jgi:hypothetical protein